MTLHRCDGTDIDSTRWIGWDEPLTILRASTAIREMAGGDLAAALDAAPVKDGRREISFKLGGDMTRRTEDRERKVLGVVEGEKRLIACDCGRLYDDALFSLEYPHDPLRPDPYATPVLERD